MDVREKMVDILKQAPFEGKVLDEWWWEEKIKRIAEHIISNGVTVQEWISVNDRLPETQVEVLTYSDGNGVRSACLLASNEETNMWYLCRTDKLSIDVTHWQPMPQPPKGE